MERPAAAAKHGDGKGASASAAQASAAGPAAEQAVKRKPGIFAKELRSMMYGFGDDPEPLQETVELMEDIVVEYLTEIVHMAQDLPGRKGKVSVEDVLFLVRKDPRKFARAKELLVMDEKLKEAKKINFQDGMEMEGGKEMESMLNM